MSLESKNNESKNTVTNKKVYLLHNALIICNWVTKFDSASINDCFDKNSINKIPN